MVWSAKAVMSDFETVARLAGVDIPRGSITIEMMPAPHVPPTNLPIGKMAVYVFSKGPDILKVGKAGPKSQARYTSQHYNPGSAMSTLAASILAERDRFGLSDTDAASIGRWIRGNVDRVNFIVDARLGVPVLTLLETFLQCRLKPRYEGFKSQRLRGGHDSAHSLSISSHLPTMVNSTKVKPVMLPPGRAKLARGDSGRL